MLLPLMVCVALAVAVFLWLQKQNETKAELAKEPLKPDEKEAERRPEPVTDEPDTPAKKHEPKCIAPIRPLETSDSSQSIQERNNSVTAGTDAISTPPFTESDRSGSRKNRIPEFQDDLARDRKDEDKEGDDRQALQTSPSGLVPPPSDVEPPSISEPHEAPPAQGSEDRDREPVPVVTEPPVDAWVVQGQNDGYMDGQYDSVDVGTGLGAVPWNEEVEGDRADRTTSEPSPNQQQVVDAFTGEPRETPIIVNAEAVQASGQMEQDKNQQAEGSKDVESAASKDPNKPKKKKHSSRHRGQDTKEPKDKKRDKKEAEETDQKKDTEGAEIGESKTKKKHSKRTKHSKKRSQSTDLQATNDATGAEPSKKPDDDSPEKDRNVDEGVSVDMSPSPEKDDKKLEGEQGVKDPKKKSKRDKKRSKRSRKSKKDKNQAKESGPVVAAGEEQNKSNQEPEPAVKDENKDVEGQPPQPDQNQIEETKPEGAEAPAAIEEIKDGETLGEDGAEKPKKSKKSKKGHESKKKSKKQPREKTGGDTTPAGPQNGGELDGKESASKASSATGSEKPAGESNKKSKRSKRSKKSKNQGSKKSSKKENPQEPPGNETPNESQAGPSATKETPLGDVSSDKIKKKSKRSKRSKKSKGRHGSKKPEGEVGPEGIVEKV